MGRRADLKTGYDCNCNCLFCVIGDKLFTGDRTTAECLEELRLSRKTCDDVVFTGAEVTIRPDFFRLVAAAAKLGYRTIQVQTNGRMLAYPDFARRAVEAGANEFSPSIHGATAATHDSLVRSRGSFEQVVGAIENLVALGQRVVTNTVVTPRNAAELPALARLLVDAGIAQYQLAFPHPTGHAATHFDAAVPRMSEVAPWVHEALQIGLDAGVGCMAEAIPFCHMRGYESQVSELYIPPTEIVYDGYVVPDYGADRMHRGKIRFEQCATCRFEPICEGPWKEYPARVGSAEFQPVQGSRIVDVALMTEPRWKMVGKPAPRWPDGAARPPGGWTAMVFFPEAFSGGCTAQLTGLAGAWDRLQERHVHVVGVSPDSPSRQRAFAAEHDLPMPLLSDEGGELARAWQAGDRGGVRRSTYLVGEDGTLAHVFVHPRIPDHAEQILDALDRLAAPPRPLSAAERLVVLRRGPDRAGAPA